VDWLQARGGKVGQPAAWAIVAGVVYAMAQPSWGLWPFAVVCLAPLLVSCMGRSAARRAVLGWLAGTVATLLSTVVPATIASTA
jgi:apolipoprotein N-acyltransferase